MPPTSSPLPIDAFSSLLPSLSEHITLLASSDQPNVGEAVAAFREKIDEARALVEQLPSGELKIGEEEEVISGLREVVQSKLRQLEIYKGAMAQRDARTADLGPEGAVAREVLSPEKVEP